MNNTEKTLTGITLQQGQEQNQTDKQRQIEKKQTEKATRWTRAPLQAQKGKAKKLEHSVPPRDVEKTLTGITLQRGQKQNQTETQRRKQRKRTGRAMG